MAEQAGITVSGASRAGALRGGDVASPRCGRPFCQGDLGLQPAPRLHARSPSRHALTGDLAQVL
jgi:hypothetical protein